MHPQSDDSKGPHPLLWAGLRAACGKIISGILNCLSYFKIFITYKQFTSVDMAHSLATRDPYIANKTTYSISSFMENKYDGEDSTYY
jgi:hypothetical protein